jgi:hypothetical protein
VKLVAIFVLSCVGAAAHDIITTPITWGHEISTIVEKHCLSCHNPKGQAFSLLTYQEVRPWAVAIREEVLKRTMPPWGAVKGFGDFSNDSSLTPEEIELIVKWTEGGVPEGEEKVVHVPESPGFLELPDGLKITGTYRLKKHFFTMGISVSKVLPGAEARVVAKLPDGTVEPLIWIKDYERRFAHPFWFRQLLQLPAGTVIEGVPKGMTLTLLATSHLHPRNSPAK